MTEPTRAIGWSYPGVYVEESSGGVHPIPGVDTSAPISIGRPMALVLDAALFAAHKHRDQRRKDIQASPYINHPLALARILAAEGGIDCPVTLAAALLHDTLEDTATTADELRQRFGPEVAAVVLEVTDDRSLNRADRKQAQIDHAPHLSERAKQVKLADLRRHLPADTRYVSPEERARQLAYRRTGYQRLFGD